LALLLCLGGLAVAADPDDQPPAVPGPLGPPLASVYGGRLYALRVKGRSGFRLPPAPKDPVELWECPLTPTGPARGRAYSLKTSGPWGERNLYRWRVCQDCFWGTGQGLETLLYAVRIPLARLPTHSAIDPDTTFGLEPVRALAERHLEVGGLEPIYATRDAWFDFLVGDKGEIHALVAWRGELRVWRGVLRLGGPEDEPTVRWDRAIKPQPLGPGGAWGETLPDAEPVLRVGSDLREPFHAFQDAGHFYFVTVWGRLYACGKRADKQRVRALWKDADRPIRAVVCDGASGRAWAFTAGAGTDSPPVWFELAAEVRPHPYERGPGLEVQAEDPLPGMLAHARLLLAAKEIQPAK
jgi:hypothetical protein